MDFLTHLYTNLTQNARHQAALRHGFNPLNRKLYQQYNRFRHRGAKPIFCYLPFNSLTFSFSGQVFVCSYNRDILLGKYPEQSIREIWEGQQAQTLRQHMRHNDLDYGCRHCKFFFDKGKFSNLRPHTFDKYYQHTSADMPRVFEFELDNKCNLECQMCHGEVSSSIRKNRDHLPPIPSPYDDAFVQQLIPYISTLEEAKFYGGEPFMIPIYHQIWDLVADLNPSLSMFVITNGSLWNQRIESLLNNLQFDVAISIDAVDAALLEKIRKNIRHAILMKNIERIGEICRRKNKYLSLSFTIQQDNWQQLPLHIELCNQHQAYAYISYLETPIQMAIASLPIREIERIRQWMEPHRFPTHSAWEKHNAQCFEDYKHYLDAYLSNDAALRYKDYETFTRAYVNHESEMKDSPKEPIIYLTNAITKDQLLDRWGSSKPPILGSVERIKLDHKLSQILQSFSLEDQNRILALLWLGNEKETLKIIDQKEGHYLL